MPTVRGRVLMMMSTVRGRLLMFGCLETVDLMLTVRGQVLDVNVDVDL